MLSKEELLTVTEEAFIDDEQLAYIRELLLDMGLSASSVSSVKSKSTEAQNDESYSTRDLSSA